MTPDAEYSEKAHWDKLQDLFHLADSEPDRDLDELLREATDDVNLRARAKVLIQSGRRSEASAVLPGAPPLPGKIGPYTIRKHLGSGGIGAVYLVERTVAGAVQRSALKVLARHAVGPFFTERFAREQYILASLQHEHITRMIDAGVTDDGQAYLVMEYVDGVNLDQYCDERSLGVPERLALFLEVCAAISYAHQNLVVHLDLKPSNILVVKESGAVKVLDFGTSKLIQADSLLTTTVMATPAYASPEQLLNEPVTTICDVYALGAILFELLSGRRPNQDSSVAALIERSLKEFPPEPITENLTEAAATHRGLTQTRLRSLLQGDLATIVSKCLNPRPKDRYATVDALIDDVNRYLAGRPIQARPQTTTYRLGKFVRRHRAAVVTGTLAVLALAAALGYAAWRQHQAVLEARRALQMQTFMQTLFRFASPQFTGKPTASVPEFLANGVRLVPSYIQDPADLRAARLSLAQSMQDAGDYKGSLPVFEQVIAEARDAHDLPSEAIAESFAASSEYSTGGGVEGQKLAEHALSLSNSRGLNSAASTNIKVTYARNMEDNGFIDDQYLALVQGAIATARHDKLPPRQLADYLLVLFDMLSGRGRLPEAEAAVEEAAAIYAREPNASCELTGVDQDLALTKNQTNDKRGSLEYMQKSYANAVQCAGEGSHLALQTQSYLAAAMLSNGESAQAAKMLETSMPLWRFLAKPESDELATPLTFLARAQIMTKQFAAAEVNARELVAVETGRVKPLSAQMAQCDSILAQTLAGQGKDAEALKYAELAEAGFAGNAKAPGTIRNAAIAHQLLLDLRAKHPQ